MDEAILKAVRELLAAKGYSALTTDTVAAAAGVGKAAIYRRHATKQEMVFAAVVHGTDLSAPEEAGSLREDIAAIVDDIMATLGNPAAAQVIPGLLADMHAVPGLRERFTELFLDRQREIITAALDRALARGEISRLPDTAFVHALLTGPVFASLYVLPQRPERLAADLTETVYRAVMGTVLGPKPGPKQTANGAEVGLRAAPNIVENKETPGLQPGVSKLSYYSSSKVMQIELMQNRSSVGVS